MYLNLYDNNVDVNKLYFFNRDHVYPHLLESNKINIDNKTLLYLARFKLELRPHIKPENKFAVDSHILWFNLKYLKLYLQTKMIK